MNIYKIAEYYFDVKTQQIQEMEYVKSANGDKFLISHQHIAKSMDALNLVITQESNSYSIDGGPGARIFEYKNENDYLSGVAIFNGQVKPSSPPMYDAIVVYYDNEYLNEFIKAKNKEQNNSYALRTSEDSIENILNLLKHSAPLAVIKSEKKELSQSIAFKEKEIQESILKI